MGAKNEPILCPHLLSAETGESDAAFLGCILHSGVSGTSSQERPLHSLSHNQRARQVLQPASCNGGSAIFYRSSFTIISGCCLLGFSQSLMLFGKKCGVEDQNMVEELPEGFSGFPASRGAHSECVAVCKKPLESRPPKPCAASCSRRLSKAAAAALWTACFETPNCSPSSA